MPLVSLSPAIRYQFFDANGDPLAFGRVLTFVAGTNTPLATYVDHLGVTLNTNPIILDAGGYADIWLTATSYKIAVQNAAGTQLYVIDGVNGLGSVISVGNLPPLFTTVFAAGAISFALSNAAAGTIFGNFGGAPGAPSFGVIGSNREITFNNAGQMDGDPNFEWDAATFTQFIGRTGNAFATPSLRFIAGASGPEIKFGTGVDPSILHATAWQFTQANGAAIQFGQRAEQGNFTLSATLGIATLGTASHRGILGLNDGNQAAGVFGGPSIFAGIGTPEGAVLANIGSLFLRRNGGAATSLYVKESNDGGNTGWVGK